MPTRSRGVRDGAGGYGRRKRAGARLAGREDLVRFAERGWRYGASRGGEGGEVGGAGGIVGGADAQLKVDSEEEVELKGVELGEGQAADLRPDERLASGFVCRLRNEIRI